MHHLCRDAVAGVFTALWECVGSRPEVNSFLYAVQISVTPVVQRHIYEEVCQFLIVNAIDDAVSGDPTAMRVVLLRGETCKSLEVHFIPNLTEPWNHHCGQPLNGYQIPTLDRRWEAIANGTITFRTLLTVWTVFVKTIRWTVLRYLLSRSKYHFLHD